MTPVNRDILYRVNERDEISFVNDEWDRFAAGNDGEHLKSSHVLCRPLWDFVGDFSTGAIYRDLLARVRAGHNARFNFRCDSPTCTRVMEMDVVPGPDGAVEFRTRPLIERPREAQLLLDPRVPRSNRVLLGCSWCKRFDIDGDWLEVEEAVARLRLFERSPLPLVTHGVCESCLAELMRVLERT